ncbi:MAG TPA: GntR family transcriptional regulator [Spirochaetia bacterium]|nr:GntR family transcriptional regulator [Spirochaetia bacterium]
MPPIDTRILTEHVYESIKSLILDGELQPGEKIDKKILAQTLGVSLTPINEAMSRLAGEKYIEQINRRGYFVKTYSHSDLTEMYEVRAGLESIAVRLCLERATEAELEGLAGCFGSFSLPFAEGELAKYTEADKRFHGLIIKMSGNSMIQEINESSGYVLKSYQQGLVRPPEETVPEHAEIIAAIRARDADVAQTLIARHHLRSATAVSRQANPLP